MPNLSNKSDSKSVSGKGNKKGAIDSSIAAASKKGKTLGAQHASHGDSGVERNVGKPKGNGKK